MKRILNLLTLVGMIVFLTACGNENKINTNAYKETENTEIWELLGHE